MCWIFASEEFHLNKAPSKPALNNLMFQEIGNHSSLCEKIQL